MGEVPLHEDAVGWRNVQLGKLWEVLFCEKPLLLEQKNKNISLGKSGGKVGKLLEKSAGTPDRSRRLQLPNSLEIPAQLFLMVLSGKHYRNR